MAAALVSGVQADASWGGVDVRVVAGVLSSEKTSELHLLVELEAAMLSLQLESSSRFCFLLMSSSTGDMGLAAPARCNSSPFEHDISCIVRFKLIYLCLRRS